MNKGYSLLEMLVVIAMMAILSLGAYESIVRFQYQSQVDAATQELVATLRDAQSKSRTGTIPQQTTADSYASAGLPFYSVSLSGLTYVLRRTDTLNTGVMETVDEETHTISSTLTVTPAAVVIPFARISGLSDASYSITLQRGTTTAIKTITVAENGLISVN